MITVEELPDPREEVFDKNKTVEEVYPGILIMIHKV